MKRHLALAAACALAIAGCGGTSHPSTSSSSTLTVTTPGPVQHACNPADYAMQCALPQLHFGLSGPSGSATVAQGADYGWGGVTAAQARANGWRFVASYLSLDPSKNFTASAVAAFHKAGVATVAVWETSANRATQGPAAGAADAAAARAQALALGNVNRPLEFAVDCDCSGASILGYFQGVHQVVGARGNAYGGYQQILYLSQHRVVGHQNWQTYAWSGGRWLPASIAPLEQYLNGNLFDHDRAIAADYGQWPIAHTGPTAAQKHRWRRGRDASYRVWHGRGCEQTVTRQDCWRFAHRVQYFQGRLGRERCYGPHAAAHRYLCRVVRPIVADQSRRRRAASADLRQCRRARCAADRREIARLTRLIHREVY